MSTQTSPAIVGDVITISVPVYVDVDGDVEGPVTDAVYTSSDDSIITGSVVNGEWVSSPITKAGTVTITVMSPSANVSGTLVLDVAAGPPASIDFTVVITPPA